MKKFLIISLLAISYISTVQAQHINVDADEKVEWYRNEQKIVAIGNTVATKGDNVLKGQVLNVFYEKVQLEDGTQKNQIQKIISEGNVKLEMSKSHGSGEYFDYSTIQQIAVLKGNPAKLESDLGEITATESITYYGEENKSIALGNVIAKNPEYTIYADKMISFFDVDSNGKKSLNRVEIYADKKPVKIVNKTATVTGSRGVYFPPENKLKIFDNVVINQQGDILKGDYAETDLKTGISRLLSSGKNNNRVSGIFHNKKKKEK